MGNASKKLAEKCTLLSKDEQPVVASSFKFASKNSDRIREDDLIKLWGGQMDPRLAQYLSNFLFGYGSTKRNIVDFQRFAELYVYCVRGTIDERTSVLFNSLGKDVDENTELSYQLIKEFTESIASTYSRMVRVGGGGPAHAAWSSKSFSARPRHVQALGEAMAAAIQNTAAIIQNTAAEPQQESAGATDVHYNKIIAWLENNVLLARMLEVVFRQLYAMTKTTGSATGQTTDEIGSTPVTGTTQINYADALLPYPDGLSFMPDYPAFVDLSHVVWINSHLPSQLRSKWRFLFSSHIHGESFSTLLGRIMDQGPSVLIIEDSAGYIFGGFAPSPWSLSPNFAGDDSSFLFSLAPKMRVYPATGYNNHYQYLNLHQQTMPNGLLMGGQYGYCGLWLSCEYGEGHSAESCSTYKGFKRLSRDKDFMFKSIEVWGVGEKPLADEDKDGQSSSILDANHEAKAILKMAGRKEHSEGLREPEPY